MVHLYLNDGIGKDTQAIFEKGVVMTILQALPTLTQTQNDHAPYLQKRRVIKRAALLSRGSSKRARGNWEEDDQGKQLPDPASVNLESMYFRGFRSRPLLHANEELKLGIRLYEGTTQLRVLFKQALALSGKLKKNQEVELVYEQLQKLIDLKGFSSPVIDESLECVRTLQSVAAMKGKLGQKMTQQATELFRSITRARVEIEEPRTNWCNAIFVLW